MRTMAYLMRVSLPDVPGSLGALASAIGAAGGAIEAIEIIEHRDDGTAVDDFFLELPAGLLPDTLVSACQRLEGVRVQWFSRYAAGGNLHLDLETVELLTQEPADAIARLAELLPETFRCDWGLALERAESGEVTVLHATDTAPSLQGIEAASSWFDAPRASRLPDVAGWDSIVLAAAPVQRGRTLVVFGRRGGPDVLDSEVARLAHLASLAGSISTA